MAAAITFSSKGPLLCPMASLHFLLGLGPPACRVERYTKCPRGSLGVMSREAISVSTPWLSDACQPPISKHSMIKKALILCIHSTLKDGIPSFQSAVRMALYLCL